MKDFRKIRKFELDWKDAESQREEMKSKLNDGSFQPSTPSGGGGLELEDLLDQYIEEEA